MRKCGVLIILLCLFITNNVFGERLHIKNKEDISVLFDAMEVGAGSFDSQIFYVKNIDTKIKGVIGFADIGGGYGSYERQLPITSTYDNSSHYFVVSLAYSATDKAMICIRECWNNSDGDYKFPELDFVLKYAIIK
ncbi:MAG: hypothetical protein E3K37_01255 [Candidatus Kuenenia sp.]|nr:hypothetical protein [Candidatus Kuenenia hertensis]